MKQSMVALVVLLAGCTSSHDGAASTPKPTSGSSATVATAVPLPPSSNDALATSSCGNLYRLHGLGPVVSVGGCAGSLSVKNVVQVQARVGDTFQMISIREQNGTPDMQAPTSDDPGVVARVAITHQGGDATYRALTAGSATLRTSTVFCNDGPIDTTQPQTPGRVPRRICPVVQVTVKPSDRSTP